MHGGGGMLSRAFTAAGIALAMGVLTPSLSRSPDHSRTASEVESVKPATTSFSIVQSNAARYNGTSTTLSLIVRAYGLTACSKKVLFGQECPLLSGASPGWLKTDRFEV